MKPKRTLNKWQFFCFTAPLLAYNQLGWRYTMLGICRFTSPPQEGTAVKHAKYDGFIITWRWWFPVERER